jgi:alkanesulfonate monooxygenase SsuD/methylene tetrahydromethanopterin reductase-like flavin-dependent oxidoreductase (luciferase family)
MACQQRRRFGSGRSRCLGSGTSPLKYAKWAEEVGFHTIVTSDHLAWTPDGLTTLLFFADVPDRMKFGSYVRCIDSTSTTRDRSMPGGTGRSRRCRAIPT